MNLTPKTPRQSSYPLILGLGISSLLYVASGHASAATDSEQYAQLDEYVITGTRTKKLLVDSPVKVQVVSQEEIRLKNARNLKEALEDVPGLLLRKIHGKSGYEVWMQGVDGKRVLVLVDGERLARSTNGTTDVTQLGVANIQQIEIVKGATSALYGSNAIGGVINVITKLPEQGIHATLKADIGSHFAYNLRESSEISDVSAAGSLSFANERWDGILNFDLADTEGFELDKDTWGHEGDLMTKANASATIGFSPDASQRFHLAGNYYDEDVTSKYGRASKQTEIAGRETVKAGYELYSANYGEIKVNYFDMMTTDTSRQDLVTTPLLDQERGAEHNEQQLAVLWSLDVEGGSLRTLGFNYIEEEINQYQWRLNNANQRIYSNELRPNKGASRREFFFQDDFQVGEKLEILPGIRFQDDSDFGRYLAPKVNGRYELSRSDLETSHIRFGIGRGYRVPTLKERFFEFDHSQHFYKVLGNEDVQPEYSDSFQLGWVYTYDSLHVIDINLFRNHLTDFIETTLSHVEPATGIRIFKYGNIARARTQGLELLGQFQVNEQFKFDLGYTYQKAIDRDTKSWLPKIPRNQVKTSFNFKPWKDLALIATANYEGKSYFSTSRDTLSKAFTTFDLKANYQVIEALGIYAGIDNITNTIKDFTDGNDLRPEEGRYGYIGLRFDY